MKPPRFTLLTDGPSDRWMLIPILEWLLRTHLGNFGVNVDYADLTKRRTVPKRLKEKILCALNDYPCECLFVHRDAEREALEDRRAEINNAIDDVSAEPEFVHVCVVPVRMTEAWLLFDESSIRRAAGNPNGEVPLSIPRLSDIENIPDPKKILHDLLREASEFVGRRRKRFDVNFSSRRVVDYLDDFSPLRELVAFRALEDDLKRTVEKLIAS